MERDLKLRNEEAEYYEMQGDIWYLTPKGVEHDKGWIVFERELAARYNEDLGKPEHRLTAKYVPDIFHDTYQSDIYTETKTDPFKSPHEAGYKTEIKKRYYLGFGRYVSPYPGEIYLGTIWTDGTYSKNECLDRFIHYLEDYMLDGYRSQEDLEMYIRLLAAEKD